MIFQIIHSLKASQQIVKFVILCFSTLLTGCAATMYVDKQANDQEYPVDSFYHHITRAALLDNIVVLEVERQASPNPYGEKYKNKVKLCFEPHDFEESIAVYIHPKDNNLHSCSDIPDALFNSLPALEPISNIKRGFIIPPLQTVLYGTSNDTITARCDCDALKGINSLPKSVYRFNKYLFYIELESGQWVKFAAGKRELFITPFIAELVTRKDFEEEKEHSGFKAQTILFETIDNDNKQYLFIRMLNSKEYIYSYYLPVSQDGSTQLFEEPLNSLFIQNDKQREEVVVEEGNPLFYALYPFSLLFDIVTFPIQYGITVYYLGKANQPQK